MDWLHTINSKRCYISMLQRSRENVFLFFSAIGILEVMPGIATIVVQNIATNKEAALGHIYAGVWGEIYVSVFDLF